MMTKLKTMKNRHSLAILCWIVLCLLISGCQQSFDQEIPASQDPPPVTSDSEQPTGNPKPALGESPIPVRGILLAGQDLPEGLGAYGFVLLGEEALDEAAKARSLAVCEAFRASLPDIGEAQDKARRLLMATFWPLKSQPEADNCDQWIAGYDQVRALQILSAVDKLNTRGPVLVAWSRAAEIGDQNRMLVLDLSPVADADLDEAMRLWRSRIVEEPEVWQQGFDPEVTRLSLVGMLNLYGDTILSFLKDSASAILG